MKTGAVDDVHRTIMSCNENDKCKEGKTIIESLGRLKYELQHDRPLE